MGDIFPRKHVHKYYFSDNKIVFEPIDPEKFGEEDLYKRVEYAILMCNSPCNDVKKVEIRKEVNINGD